MPTADKETSRAKGAGLRQRIMSLLKGTHNHFLFVLPTRNGAIPWLLGRIYRGIRIDDNQLDIIRRLPPDAILVYTMKFKSYFEFLCYHTRYQQKKIPPPVMTFDMRPLFFQPISRILRSMLAHVHWWIERRRAMDPYENGYWRQELLDGQAAILPLVEKHGFYRRFVKAQTDPLRFLIELQHTTNRPIFLIPHLMFFSRNPLPAIPRLRDVLFGTEQRPGLMRRLVTLFRNPDKVFLEISQPLDLRKFIAGSERSETNQEYLALMLRRQLLLQHNRHRQSITGPVVKSHEEFKEELLSGERLREFMSQYAESRDKDIYEVRKQADNYLDEIAAKYSHFMVGLAHKPITWLLNSMFEDIVLDHEGLQRVKTMSQKGPLILVPCHKSHMDYLILSPVFYQHNMPAPHIAAGKNLSFWPIGAIFRSVGAFFVRRTFAGAVVYAKVFGDYIFKLLKEGFNIELFIEGGRSRSGKLLMPKLGFVTLLLKAFKDGACDDMIFVPIFIGYDQVLEENAYLDELTGGKKEPENIIQVIRARRFLKSRYGKIYINFHEPVSLRDTLQENNTSLTEMSTKEQNTLCRNLGWRIINAIDEITVVTPHSLVASAALNFSAPRFTTNELMQNVETHLAFLYSQKAKLADTLAVDPQKACEQALENYIQRKLIEMPGGEKDMQGEIAQYVLPSGKRLQLEYYKNNAISYFLPAAFTSVTILEMDAFQFSKADLHDRYRFLQDLFIYEFAFNQEKSAEMLVRKSIKAFIDDAILIPHATLPDTYQITSAGYRKLKLFSRFLLTYLESYLVVLTFFKQTPRTEASAKDRLKRIQTLGKSMYRKQEIVLAESLSKINYENGISLLTTNGVRGAESEEKIAMYEQTLRAFIHMIKQ